MPKFLDEHREEMEIQNENIATVEDKHAEYLSLKEEYCRMDLTFKEFCDLRYKTKSIGGFRNHNQNYESNNFLGRISLPYFDGSSKCTTSSWVQKIDTYFQLNPMVEREAIKMATLHLGGEANY